jgi:RNA polymerase sigma-70 factor (ECF subfamily)
VKAVESGDARIAGELHDRLVGIIDQTLYRILGHRQADHDDLVQSAFEQIVRSLVQRSFEGGCSLRTWASRITTHVALNSIRSRQRERRVLVRQDEPMSELCVGQITPESGERRTEARMELKRLQGHLAAMSALYTDPLILHDVHGHDLKEIAALLNVTVSAAQSRLVRGRRELKARLEKDVSVVQGRRS